MLRTHRKYSSKAGTVVAYSSTSSTMTLDPQWCCISWMCCGVMTTTLTVASHCNVFAFVFHSCAKSSIIEMKMGAEFNGPNGMHLNRYLWLSGAKKANFGRDSGCMLIWWYPESKSILMKYWALPRSCTASSHQRIGRWYGFVTWFSLW